MATRKLVDAKSRKTFMVVVVGILFSRVGERMYAMMRVEDPGNVRGAKE